jgi:hypothetical protein
MSGIEQFGLGLASSGQTREDLSIGFVPTSEFIARAVIVSVIKQPKQSRIPQPRTAEIEYETNERIEFSLSERDCDKSLDASLGVVDICAQKLFCPLLCNLKTFADFSSGVPMAYCPDSHRILVCSEADPLEFLNKRNAIFAYFHHALCTFLNTAAGSTTAVRSEK